MNHPMIEALLRERAGYVRRGLPDRIAMVDEQLAAFGHRVEATVKSPPENAMQPKPIKRRSPRG